MNDHFEDLLKVVPRIADAVKGFASEDLQKQAFHILVKAYGHEPGSLAGSSTPRTIETPVAKAEKQVSRPKAAKPTVGFLKDLNLHPTGKQSFEDFIAEKAPKSDQDKYPVVIYYLEHILEIAPISVEYVNSVFRLTRDWKEPRDIKNGLALTASRKGTINTADLTDLRTTPTGRNFVERELPLKKK